MTGRLVALAFALVLVTSLGCGAASSTATSSEPVALPTPPELAGQAAADLSCAQVAIEALPNWMARVSGGLSTHIARGCGREAGYDCARQPCALRGVRAIPSE
jgi:hypothetical protein